MAKKFTRKGRKTRSAGRFGVRYGTKSRKLIADIEERMRQGYKCPRCGVIAVRRIHTGIWNCKKCNHTFSGGTYVPLTSVGLVASRSVKKAMEIEVLDEFEEIVPEEIPSPAEDVISEMIASDAEETVLEKVTTDAENDVEDEENTS